jgi:preprotein translocase subunit SecG
MVKKLRINKLGMEMSLNTVVGLIIVMIVLVIIIAIYISQTGEGTGNLVTIGGGAVDGALEGQLS